MSLIGAEQDSGAGVGRCRKEQATVLEGELIALGKLGKDRPAGG